MIQVIASFCVVIGLLFGFLYTLRYLQQKQWFAKLGLQPKNIQVMESFALDAKRRIVWVRHESDAYLILLGINQDTVLKGPVPYLTASTNTNDVTSLPYDLSKVSL